MNCKHIIGPPGCGKTHACMRNIEALLNSGFSPQNIAFVSFTRAAVVEARKRVQERFGVSREEIPYFGTIHSMAYRAVGISRESVLNSKRWGEFCKSVNLDHTSFESWSDDDITEPAGNKEGDILKRFHEWRRNCLLSFEDGIRQFSVSVYEEFSRPRARWFDTKFEDYKNDLGLYDFTDMLTELLELGWFPPVKVLIVDETQDLSPLQKAIILQWAESIGNLLLAYDGDQCIFDFQGADPKWLLDMEGQREFLTQSYRVPSKPSKVAQRIISRNKQRYNVQWDPIAAEGEVKFDVELDSCIRLCAKTDESWYFLARNRMYIPTFAKALMDKGIPFVNLRGYSPKVPTALVSALSLSLGESISVHDLDLLLDEIPQKEWLKRGAKTEVARLVKEKTEAQVSLQNIEAYGALPSLISALSTPETAFPILKVEKDKREYFLRVHNQYGMAGLTDPPKVTLSTIHGVKGGEAQNVVIDPQMTRRTYESYTDNSESERRIWYVGASRTENRLFILDTYNQPAYMDW